MKTKKRILALLVAICVCVVMMPTMAFADDLLTAPSTIVSAPAEENIVILATSDVHCGISDNIGYAGLAAYKKEVAAAGNTVFLVDAGDAVQGGPIGTLSKGEYLVDILNKVGYDVLVPGNHEFDYGMDQFLNVIVKNMKAPYISCNFVTKSDNKPVFDAYTIKEANGKKIAFIGITTPEAKAKSTPAYFQDEKGNWKYDFCNDDTGAALYKQVQAAIDAAKKDGADYIIAVGHIGDDPDTVDYWHSDAVVANTTGLDAFIDGHAHHVSTVALTDKAGKSVPYVQTGTKLANIGKVVITKDGAITTENVDSTVATAQDETVAKFISGIQEKYTALTEKVVAKSTVDLVTHDGDTRLVRKQETNLGDLCADAYRIVSGADIGFANGGGIRAAIPAGDITYGDILSVFPYGNMLCVCEATGQEILDALELGSKSVGSGESGGFLHVSGLTYSINTFIPSSVVTDEDGMFVKVDGKYRVYDVKVGGKALDLEKTYTLACHNYKLKTCGDGYTMFADNVFLQDCTMIDNQLLIKYITENLGGVVGKEYAKPQGRISILTAESFSEAKDNLKKASASLATAKAKLNVVEFKPVVKATATKDGIKLTWNACSAKGVKYQIFKSSKKNGNFKKYMCVSVVKGTSKTIKRVTAGNTYNFKVRAVKTVKGKVYTGQFSKVASVEAK